MLRFCPVCVRARMRYVAQQRGRFLFFSATTFLCNSQGQAKLDTGGYKTARRCQFSSLKKYAPHKIRKNQTRTSRHLGTFTGEQKPTHYLWPAVAQQKRKSKKRFSFRPRTILQQMGSEGRQNIKIFQRRPRHRLRLRRSQPPGIKSKRCVGRRRFTNHHPLSRRGDKKKTHRALCGQFWACLPSARGFLWIWKDVLQQKNWAA